MSLLFNRDKLKVLYAANREKRIKAIESLLNREEDLSSDAGASHKFIMQQDKDETLLTLYTMAALDEKKESSWKALMEKAFPNDDWSEFTNPELKLEKAISPYEGIQESLKDIASKNPVKYLRDGSKKKTAVEGKTVFDCILDQSENSISGKTVFIECKFTSDISVQTTYLTIRNQLARCIDVGLA